MKVAPTPEVRTRPLGWRALFVLAVALACGAPASANIVLTIDYSNLSAVKFTATGNASLINYSGSLGFGDGIAILGFLTSGTGVQDFVTAGPTSTYNGSTSGGGLTDSANNGANAARIFRDLTVWNDSNPSLWTNYGQAPNGSGVDLTLWSNTSSGQTLSFSTGSAAFYGEATFNLSTFPSITALFPALNSTGNVVLWNGNGTIGTWQVVGVSAVPEPSTYATIFGAVALAGVVVRRRRQRSAA